MSLVCKVLPGIFDSPAAQWFHGNEPDIFPAGLAQYPAAGHFRVQQAHRQLDGVEKIELERPQAITGVMYYRAVMDRSSDFSGYSGK